MAEVWSARAEGPGGFVKSLALKFISDSFTGDADLERLFVNEARVAAQLQHANLVCVFDFDKWSDPESGEPGRYYIAMERIDGQDLRRVLQVARHKGQKLAAPLALHIIGEVLKGLRYVHERREDGGTRPLGLVHRDVSPHNVLIGMAGEVKLSDFGIAKAMSQSLGTQAGTIRGKLAYASPEQLSGEPVDHRADQFALGVTFWEMLAARRLFEGADEMEIVGKVLRCDIPYFPAAAGVDPAVEEVVRRMLARAPGDRFASTAQALAAVMAAPAYAPHAPALADFMQALFAPRAMVLPPTVPLQLPDAPLGRGGLAETSALEPNALEDHPSGSNPSPAKGAAWGRSGSGPTVVSEERVEGGLQEDPVDVPERAAATGSGYVSANTPHVPSWIEQPESEPAATRRRPVAPVLVAVAVIATVIAARRLRSPPPAPPAVMTQGPRPSVKERARAAGSIAVRPAPQVVREAVRSAAPAGSPATPPSPAVPLPAPAFAPSAPPKPGPPAIGETGGPGDPVLNAQETVLEKRSRRRAAGRRSSPEEDRRTGVPESAPAPSSAQKAATAANGAPILE